jgi:hypothetical protein
MASNSLIPPPPYASGRLTPQVAPVGKQFEVRPGLRALPGPGPLGELILGDLADGLDEHPPLRVQYKHGSLSLTPDSVT